MNVLEISPGFVSEIDIRPETEIVQFSRPLSDFEYEALASALADRPDVTLRVYDHEGCFRELDFLRHFRAIRKLDLDLWSLESLDGIEAIHELDSFSFGATKKKHSLRFIERFKVLRRLYIEGHAKDAEAIGGLATVESLTLRSITLPHLEWLVPLRKLRRLEIKLGGTKNLLALANLPNLRYLELWLIRQLRDLSVIGDLKSLEVLYLQAMRNVVELPSLRSLHKLRLVHLETMKGLSDLRAIADAPALQYLSLVDMRMTVDAIRPFVGHPTLRYFSGGLGSVAQNAEAKALLGLSSEGSWRDNADVFRDC